MLVPVDRNWPPKYQSSKMFLNSILPVGIIQNGNGVSIRNAHDATDQSFCRDRTDTKER